MTDLLQSAVLTGTGRAAQIGRPVAGKTGTTSSNKDGWFVGFSSGLTTGVWMGRDDARADRRASGRHRAGPCLPRFHGVAVARRPVEQFETKVPIPDWDLEPTKTSWAATMRLRQRPVRRRKRQSRSTPIRLTAASARSRRPGTKAAPVEQPVDPYNRPLPGQQPPQMAQSPAVRRRNAGARAAAAVSPAARSASAAARTAAVKRPRRGDIAAEQLALRAP